MNRRLEVYELFLRMLRFREFLRPVGISSSRFSPSILNWKGKVLFAGVYWPDEEEEIPKDGKVVRERTGGSSHEAPVRRNGG